MQNHVNVLVTEIDPAVAENIAQTLEAMGHACTVATEPEKRLEQAASGNHEVVIVNLALPDGEGWEILREARRARPEVQIIALGGDEDIPAGVKAMSEGATNYLHKPLNHTEFSIVVDRAAEYISLHRDR
ncbi:MAG: response regulator, partial [Planctomycetes bacterium]|nr:response regulator [Planctomycetota bacterium]